MKVKNLNWKIKEKVVLLFNPVKINKDLRKRTEKTSRIKDVQFAIINQVKDSNNNPHTNGDNDHD